MSLNLLTVPQDLGTELKESSPTRRRRTLSASSAAFDLPVQNTASASTSASASASATHPPSHDDSNEVPQIDIESADRSNVPGELHPSLESSDFLVVSGGTACNDICSAFGRDACYVLPVSDDGGSSSEIIRVLGGPSVGDIRSRLVRLIPSSPAGSPLDAVRNLLAHRLPVSSSEEEAREQWRELVEGRGSLWDGIPDDRKETIRGFLVHFESEILRRAHKRFSFRNGSVGNYLLAGAGHFFRSLPSAIFLFSSITGSQANILPAVVTNHVCTIAAILEDGNKIIGQCQISHPVPGSRHQRTASETRYPVWEDDQTPRIPQNVTFSKSDETPEQSHSLESPISKLLYINPYGEEIYPSPNPGFIDALRSRKVLVYSCGSLWTSLIPCLCLRGVGTEISQSRTLQYKVLLLNSTNDRETTGYTASDYIEAIVGTLTRADLKSPRSQGKSSEDASSVQPASAFITHLVYLEGTSIPIDFSKLKSLGIRCIAARHPAGAVRYDADVVSRALDAMAE